MSSTHILSKKKPKNNNSFDFKNDDDDKLGSNIEPKSSKALKLEKCRSDLIKDNLEENSIYQKYKKNSSKVIKELNEDNISISESSEDKDEDNQFLSEIKVSKKSQKSINNNKVSFNLGENSSSISDDNPETYKEIDKILNNNQTQNDNDKIHEKAISSFNNDKSTKMEIDKKSYSEV